MTAALPRNAGYRRETEPLESAAMSLARALTMPGVPLDAELGLHVYSVEQSVAALEEVTRVERLHPDDASALRLAANNILLILLRNDSHGQ
jgi:hypothetical protein